MRARQAQMHTASQALAIERQASAQPSLAERVSRPKTRAILGLMRLNFLSVSLADVEGLLEQYQPGYAVVDLKLKGEASGLACVQTLHAADEEMLIVVLTGFASIATAVEAVKLGACHYLGALVWCLKSKHQIIELAARATDARMVSALLRHTKGFGSWL
jgi:DNA-binding NtrC family response regulator